MYVTSGRFILHVNSYELSMLEKGLKCLMDAHEERGTVGSNEYRAANRVYEQIQQSTDEEVQEGY